MKTIKLSIGLSTLLSLVCASAIASEELILEKKDPSTLSKSSPRQGYLYGNLTGIEALEVWIRPKGQTKSLPAFRFHSREDFGNLTPATTSFQQELAAFHAGRGEWEYQLIPTSVEENSANHFSMKSIYGNWTPVEGDLDVAFDAATLNSKVLSVRFDTADVVQESSVRDETDKVTTDQKISLMSIGGVNLIGKDGEEAFSVKLQLDKNLGTYVLVPGNLDLEKAYLEFDIKGNREITYKFDELDEPRTFSGEFVVTYLKAPLSEILDEEKNIFVVGKDILIEGLSSQK